MRAVGNVATTTTEAVYNVQLELKVFDFNDQLFATAQGTTVFTATLPGQLNPFDFGVGVDISQVARTEVNLVNWSMTSTESYVAPTIVMTDTLITPTMTYITTTIRNDQTQALINVQGVAWSLDQWSCICVHSIIDYLPPGETSVFTSTVYVSSLAMPVIVAVQGITEP